MPAFWFDIRFGLRVLRRSPGFSALAILTLALGIGANTAIFGLFNGVLLRPLAFREPGRLVAVQETVSSGRQVAPSLPVNAWHFNEWRKSNHSFEQMALLYEYSVSLTSGGEPELLSMGRVSSSLFPMLGVGAQIGRTFLEEEDRPGHDHVVIIGHRLWETRFHGDPAVVGRNIVLDGVPYEVVGVLPAGLEIPKPSQLYALAFADTYPELWKPFAVRDQELSPMGDFNYGAIARLKPGVSLSTAAADLNVIQAAIRRAVQTNEELGALITPLQEQITGHTRQSLMLLLAAVGAVLLIVCVNVANLLLARAAARRRELAIRAAIGAGLGRLVRQMLTESLLLAGIGGALGVVFARWALAAIVLSAPVEIPRLEQARMDPRVLAFALALAVSSGLFFGILPAWRIARSGSQDALKSSGRAVTEGRRGVGLRRLLIGAEATLSAMCLVVAGLLLHSFVLLTRVDKGFRTDHAITVSLGLPLARYPDTEHRAQFFHSLLDRAYALPGVAAAGITNRMLLSGQGSDNVVVVEGSSAPPEEWPIIDYRCISPGFFRTLGIALVAGRIFEEGDHERGVAVVSVQTARKLWPGADAIGKRFHLGGPGQPLIEVVGISGDVRAVSLQRPANLTVYLPYWQRDRQDMALIVRTVMDPATIASALRTEVRRLDAQLPVGRFRTMDEVMDESVAQRRFQLDLVVVFAGAALLLAAMGVYGVVSQTVIQRTNEIGIRMALGATRQNVWGLVVRQGLAPVVGGLVVGLAGAMAASRLVSDMLFGVAATDSLTFAAVAAVLLAAAGAACYVPARRATRLDPLVALRYE